MIAQSILLGVAIVAVLTSGGVAIWAQGAHLRLAKLQRLVDEIDCDFDEFDQSLAGINAKFTYHDRKLFDHDNDLRAAQPALERLAEVPARLDQLEGLYELLNRLRDDAAVYRERLMAVESILAAAPKPKPKRKATPRRRKVVP